MEATVLALHEESCPYQQGERDDQAEDAGRQQIRNDRHRRVATHVGCDRSLGPGVYEDPVRSYVALKNFSDTMRETAYSGQDAERRGDDSQR